jgi:dTDP-4-dehydrorhamnose 3,5-epimerase
MHVETTSIAGVLLVTPTVFRDPRGFFVETYHEERYQAAGMPARFVQDNHSLSAHATLRGLHAQLRRAQAKLVRCVQGSIWDVAVDIREGSPTFGRWAGAELSAATARQIYIPEGFAHGFAVLSETAEVEYKCSDVYVPDDQLTVRWNDPDLDIAWPLKDPLLSEKDRIAPLLKDLAGKLPKFGS